MQHTCLFNFFCASNLFLAPLPFFFFFVTPLLSSFPWSYPRCENPLYEMKQFNAFSELRIATLIRTGKNPVFFSSSPLFCPRLSWIGPYDSAALSPDRLKKESDFLL